MRLTTKSRYGTRLVLDIALNGQNGPVRLGDIATRQGISVKYLEKLISKLKAARIIKSVRGPYGGHLLARQPEEITVGDLVRVLEGVTALTECAESEKKLCGECNKAGDCITRWIWIETSEAMFKKLDSFTIAALMDPTNAISPD